MNKLAKEFNVSPLKITAWKNEFSQKAHAAIIKPKTSQAQLVNLNVKQDRHLKKGGELSIEECNPCKSFKHYCELYNTPDYLPTGKHYL